jgi:hypothetical protein
MYGIGYISRTLADTLQVGNGLGKLPPMMSNYGNAFVIDYVPLSEIYTDESNFQNRGDKYSEKSVKSIIDAVANGSFNWFAFDPVILWENPADGKKYVLSGHSRTQAFRQLAKMHPDWIVDGLTFTAIPARIYRGSFEDAKRLALNSNTLATPETLTERAAYYRRIRERQGITKGKDLKALKDKALRENNGQMIWDLSYLPEGGISFDSLKAFKLGEESGSTENFLRLATICQWIGKAFQIYKGLSKAHDRELFNFLMSGGYGSKSGQYFNFSSLNDRLQKLYTKNVADDRKVNANGEYTEPFQIAAYKKDDATLDTLDDLKKTADGAYKDLKRKLKELRDNNATREQIYEIATPYFNGWANALYDWWSLLDRTPKTDNAPSLFGLGRISPEQYFNIDFFKYPERLFDIAETAINNEYVGNAQELDNQLRQMSDLRLLSDYQDSDDELINILRNNIKSDAYKSQTPTKDDVRFTQRKWNRWAHVQKLWGDFIDALALMVVPQDLISRYFKAIIVRPRSNEEKTFPDIAKALDFAFDKGQLNRNSWIILNDRNKAVLTDNDVPKSLDGVLCGIFGVAGLGKPTIKLEFEDNAELLAFQDTIKKSMPQISEPVEWNSETETFDPGVSGLTVNDKPAAIFNCPESALDTQGFAPTYIRLADYSHLIDAADGAKTLKGYGFEKATLDELVNACQNYRQVERLAAHLKDDDEMQSAFNIWHWLHTNVRYNYDAPGEEEIRTPARVWADRYSGVDCDCLAVFTACLLICMGYKPKFEIVAFNNSPTFSHIYVNLDGMAIDRVLPVFLARPGNITKTQIMEIPVYSLSGIDGCNTLSGVYTSTLAKVQNGTATGEDLNNLRKTEVLLTLKGLDDDEYKLAKILMPYVVTIGDDGKYYFDNAKLAAVAQKVDAELALLKQQNATPEAMTQWLAKVLDQLDGVSVDAQTPSDEDTIVVIINPKGCPCHVTGQFVSTDLQTLTPDSSAASTAAATASPSADSPLYATTPAPIATPPDAESESGNTWLWIAGISAAFGIGAALASGSGNKKRR